MLKVVKFGGSSLASAEQFKKVKKIITADESRRYVVPSAPGKRFPSDTKITDMLYQCYKMAICEKDFTSQLEKIKKRYDEIIEGLGLELSLEEEFAVIRDNFAKKAGRDYAASRGEYLNGIVISAYLGFEFIDAADVIFFGENGALDMERTNEALKERLSTMDCAVVPGFYGRNANGKIQTFSRGGSDITGSIVARAIRANVYENWTDVSGVLIADPRIIYKPEGIETMADMYENWTDVSGFLIADPRIVDNPKPIDAITYKELRELSYMGATVLHEDAIFPVRKAGIPINIRNTNAPEDKGTLIVESTCRKSKYTITGIAGHCGFASINIEKAMMNNEIGFGRKVLEVFENNCISFEHIPSGIDTMTIFVQQKDFEEKEQKVLAELHRAVDPDMIELETDLALIAVVGRGMRATRGTAGRIFSALAHANINIRMIDQGSSELNIIIGVRSNDFESAIKAIYDIFVITEL